MNSRSTDCEADALTTTPSHRVNRISPLPNYHDRFRTYFVRSSIVQVVLFYRWQFTMLSLRYNLPLERKMFRGCMISFWKGKTVSLLCDLSLEKNNVIFAIYMYLSLKRKKVITAVQYVLNFAKFYFTTYFTVGIHMYRHET